LPETRFREYDQLGRGRVAVVVGPLELVRRNVPERLQQAARVVPCDPLQRGELDVLDAPPGPASVDLLRLIEPDDGFRERVVVESPVLPTDGSMPAWARRSV
jgi:hypothetical protein